MRTFLCGCEHVKMWNRCASCPHERVSLAGGCMALVCWELYNNYFFSSAHCWLNEVRLFFCWKHDCAGWLWVPRAELVLSSSCLQWDTHSRLWIVVRCRIHFRSADLDGLEAAPSSYCYLICLFESRWTPFQTMVAMPVLTPGPCT